MTVISIKMGIQVTPHYRHDLPKTMRTNLRRTRFCRLRGVKDEQTLRTMIKAGRIYQHVLEGVGLRQVKSGTPTASITWAMLTGRIWLATGRK